MAAPASDVDICNLALDKLGQREISATGLTAPTTEIEKVCSRHYDQARRKVLRKYIFNFARKLDILEESTDVSPAYGYSAAFYVPTDCLKVLVVGDATIGGNLRGLQYEIAENYIYTSYDDAGDLNVEYVFDAENVAEFDPLFIDVLVSELAASMAYKFTLKPSLVAAIKQDLLDAQMAAAAAAGQERPPRRIQTSRIKDVRRFGSHSRDNTRYPF
jgi:hypothetical protein